MSKRGTWMTDVAVYCTDAQRDRTDRIVLFSHEGHADDAHSEQLTSERCCVLLAGPCWAIYSEVIFFETVSLINHPRLRQECFV
jgi:hypothetical protein